ncbi:MAG: hypothetical protein INR73_16280 [Williamsia sp.]|nr:hypothetical protein [Williamsia sp.]
MIKRRITSVVCLALLLNFISCSKTDSTPDTQTPPPVNKCTGSAGTLFTAVKTLIQQRCVSCHNNTISNGGMNFTVDCNIITNQALIKSVAVDQNIMPPVGGPLSQTDKNKITAWITAGGAITN